MRHFWQWWSCLFGAHEEWYLIARTTHGDGTTLLAETTLLYECWFCKRHKTIVLQGKLATPVQPVHTPAARAMPDAPKVSRWKA